MTAPATETHGSASADNEPLERRIADGPRGGARTWFDVLEVGPDASAGELQKAYERAIALVEGRSIGGYLMLDPMAAESARADVEAAYAVLGDPERRRVYQERLAATGDVRAAAPQPATPAAERTDEHAAGTTTSAKTEHLLEVAAAATAAPGEGAAGRVAGWSDEGEPEVDESVKEARALLGLPEGDAGAEGRRASQQTFLAPEARAGSPELPRAATPRPGTLDIRFEAPSTDSGPATAMPAEPSGVLAAGPAAAPPAAPPVAPSLAAALEPAPLTPTATVSPTAAMPAPTAGSELPQPGELPDDISGALIRELREARGFSIDDVAVQTKVRKGVLQAIEEQDIPNLPARVYLRGFLTQVGRVLKVDRNRLAEGYLKTIEKVQRG